LDNVGKNVSYFYNKCRPVNCMHYIKCAVNSSLLTLFWLLQKVCGPLNTCFVTTHSIHLEDDLKIYFGVIFHQTMHHKQAHITSGAFIHRTFILAVTSTQTAARVAKHFLHPHLVLQPLWGCGDLGSFQLCQSTSSLEGA